jgi:RNA-binding protein
MSLTSKERATLRGEAHHLSVMVHIGQHGVTQTLLRSLDDALRTKELVKVSLGKGIEFSMKALAGDLAESVGADVVQVIGRTATLYRENPDLERKKGDLPPWKA